MCVLVENVDGFAFLVGFYARHFCGKPDAVAFDFNAVTRFGQGRAVEDFGTLLFVRIKHRFALLLLECLRVGFRGKLIVFIRAVLQLARLHVANNKHVALVFNARVPADNVELLALIVRGGGDGPRGLVRLLVNVRIVALNGFFQTFNQSVVCTLFRCLVGEIGIERTSHLLLEETAVVANLLGIGILFRGIAVNFIILRAEFLEFRVHLFGTATEHLCQCPTGIFRALM